MNQTKPTLIFDMDGVILDTEQLVRRCWNEIAPEFHADAIDAVFLTTVGTTRVHTCSILRERYGADFPAEEFNNAVSRRYHAIDDIDGVPVKTGARALLQWARDNAYTIGLASSTRQAVVEKELSERGLLSYFDYVLGGDRLPAASQHRISTKPPAARCTPFLPTPMPLKIRTTAFARRMQRACVPLWCRISCRRPKKCTRLPHTSFRI